MDPASDIWIIATKPSINTDFLRSNERKNSQYRHTPPWFCEEFQMDPNILLSVYVLHLKKLVHQLKVGFRGTAFVFGS
jgi:hypothetical protein